LLSKQLFCPNIYLEQVEAVEMTVFEELGINPTFVSHVTLMPKKIEKGCRA
jgi:hypothetical protein